MADLDLHIAAMQGAVEALLALGGEDAAEGAQAALDELGRSIQNYSEAAAGMTTVLVSGLIVHLFFFKATMRMCSRRYSASDLAASKTCTCQNSIQLEAETPNTFTTPPLPQIKKNMCVASPGGANPDRQVHGQGQGLCQLQGQMSQAEVM